MRVSIEPYLQLPEGKMFGLKMLSFPYPMKIFQAPLNPIAGFPFTLHVSLSLNVL